MKAGGFFPLIAVLVQPRDSHVVHLAVLRLVLPDQDLDASITDLPDRSILVVLRHTAHSFPEVGHSTCADGYGVGAYWCDVGMANGSKLLDGPSAARTRSWIT